MKVEKVSDLSREESWIVDRCDVTVEPANNVIEKHGESAELLHAADSSDDDDNGSDEESDISNENEPALKKIKLLGT